MAYCSRPAQVWRKTGQTINDLLAIQAHLVKNLQATLQTGRLGEGAHVACSLDLPTSPAQTFLSSAKGDLEIF